MLASSAGARAVEAILAKGEPVYGINTGFGRLANIRIEPADLATLQRNIVLSHAAGVGEPMPAPLVRLMLALKLASLGQGASGARLDTVQFLAAMLSRGLLPVVPTQGSVGASGDLAPLAHMAAAMIGVGEVMQAGERLARRRGAGAGRHAADRAWRQGRPRAAERHAVLHRLCAGRTVRGGDAAAGGPDHRRAVHRCRARIGCAVRSAHPRAARPSRTDRRGPCAARADCRQRDPCVASHRRRPRAGSLLPALPAAGHGRRAGYSSPCGGDVADRSERRIGQSADLRRSTGSAVGRQFPRRAGCLRGRHHRACAVRDRRHRRTPHRHADRSVAVAAAGIPDAEARV